MHVMHISLNANAAFFLPDTEGAQIHQRVQPLDGETIVVKHFPDGFLRTELREIAERASRFERLVICGMMSHMCVDTTVRTAKRPGVFRDLARRRLHHQGPYLERRAHPRAHGARRVYGRPAQKLRNGDPHRGAGSGAFVRA